MSVADDGVVCKRHEGRPLRSECDGRGVRTGVRRIDVTAAG
jgi:hypothetical protein